MTTLSRSPGIAHPRLALPQGPEDLNAFHAWLKEAIPMVSAMGIQHMAQSSSTLCWALALAPALNDKGTGFGGALSAQTTLQGWCWVTLWLRQQGRAQDVVIADASQRYLAPVTADYRLECAPAEPDGMQRLADRLTEHGKGRIRMAHRLYCGDTLCLEASGDYAVLPAR